MRNYLFLKPSKKIPFYSPKLIVSLPDLPPSPPPFFFLDSKEQAEIAEDIEDFSDCLKYLSACHKNGDDFLKMNSAMGYCYTMTGQPF